MSNYSESNYPKHLQYNTTESKPNWMNKHREATRGNKHICKEKQAVNPYL